MVSQKTLYRTRLVSATVLAGASIGALFLRFGRPEEEPPHDILPRPRPVAPADPDCGPRRGDYRCEVRKGEADPLSITFDPESCGFCGDDIRQVTAPAGAPPVMDLDSGITTQQVTERPSETAETCPVDFHCGNGSRERRQTYGAWLSPPEEAGPDAAYRLGTKTITENGDCPADAPRMGRRERDAGAEDAQEPEPRPLRPSGSMWDCPSFAAPSQNADMVDLHSSSVATTLSRVYGAINSNSPALRRALGVSDEARVKVTLSIRVEPLGYMTFNRISATCEGRPCGDAQAIVDATGLSLDGLTLGGLGTECFWTLAISVPRAVNGNAAQAPAQAPDATSK